jgi:hypothetical protein
MERLLFKGEAFTALKIKKESSGKYFKPICFSTAFKSLMLYGIFLIWWKFGAV